MTVPCKSRRSSRGPERCMSFKLTKKEILKEVVKCGKDPSYFLKTYARISHPMHGLILFNTFDYQH